MITLYEKAYSFTHPANTTAYASGDLVANSVTVGSVVPLSWAFLSNAPVKIPAVRLTINKSDITNATFWLHLLSAARTFTSADDNGAVGTVVNRPGFAGGCLV
jgi:hypothetical protein